ncbi:hypothetical protein EXIGLDRAFT_765043 [Exidia glandulosa HHB12029]|uniref:LysM domain-containing protein n=1 Tax=Exidia glandulosa HHB12029 TaxID=1314781 RepID=A0A165KSJ9_EXIGL|nr:hypothetical protein EXIGLDRAFT_765043 [Exidia glandulosa HHB12029]
MRSAGILIAFASSFVLSAWASGPRTECVYLYNAKTGETCASVGASTGTSVAAIKSINPGIDCDAPFTASTTPVCCRQYTPTCAAWEIATQPTCDYLLPKWHLSKAQFVKNNNDVDDKCGLVVGKEYCATTDSCEVQPAECCRLFPTSQYCDYVQ